MLNPQLISFKKENYIVQLVKDNFEASEQQMALKDFYTALRGFDSQRVITTRDNDLGWQLQFLWTRKEFRGLIVGGRRKKVKLRLVLTFNLTFVAAFLLHLFVS